MMSSPGRHVRTRLYFTSESHIHSLLTVLSHGGLVHVSWSNVFNSKYFVVLEWGWAMETRPGIRFSCLRTQLHDSGKFKLTPHKIFLHTYLLYKLLEFWNCSIFSVYRSWSCCMRTQQKIQPVKRGKHIFIPLEMLITRSGSTSSCTSPPGWTAASRRSFPPAPAFDHTAGTMSRYKWQWLCWKECDPSKDQNYDLIALECRV